MVISASDSSPDSSPATFGAGIVELSSILLHLSPKGGGVLPSKRLPGMCRCMGSHFHNWTDYNGVTFLVELLEWGRKFSGFLG